MLQLWRQIAPEGSAISHVAVESKAEDAVLVRHVWEVDVGVLDENASDLGNERGQQPQHLHYAIIKAVKSVMTIACTQILIEAVERECQLRQQYCSRGESSIQLTCLCELDGQGVQTSGS